MLQRRLTAQDLLSLDNVSDTQLSPDGRRIALVRRIRDLDHARSTHRIWILDIESEVQTPITDRTAICIAPRWSPDGAWLAWLDLTDEEAQLGMQQVGAPDSNTVRIDLPVGSHAIAWSPCGGRIAFLAPAQGHADEPETLGVTVVGPDHGQTDLCVFTLADRTVTRVTEDRFAVTDFSWHPGSRSIAVCATPSLDPAVWDRGDLWHIDLDGSEPKRLLAGRCTRAIWSPDGDRLAVVRLGIQSFLETPALEIVTRDGTSMVFDPFDEEFQLLVWNDEGMLALSIEGPSSHLYWIDPETGAVQRVMPNAPEGFTLIEGWFGQGCSLSADRSRMAFTAYDVAHPGEAAVLDLRSGQLDILTDLVSTYREWNLPSPERFSWSASDGTPLSGVLLRPQPRESEKGAPLIVVLHGGPTAMASLSPFADNDWIWGAIPLMLQRGAMVLLPDYRGSAGYGSDFRRMNERRVGLVNLDDVGAAIDELAAQGWTDRSRVGAVGASHGGFLAALLATATDLLSAAVCRSGIADWTLNYELNQNPGWERQYFGGSPWEHPEAYHASSPVAYLGRAKTPVLLLHGDQDRQAPTANAYALHRGLTEHDVPTRLVIFNGAGHGGGSLKQLERGIKETVDWFETWLGLVL